MADSLPVAMIMAGGTGGHVYPALAVAAELQRRGFQIHWFGTASGLEASVVPEAGYPLHCLNVLGLRGKGLMGRIRGALAVVGAVVAALSILRKLRPRVVLGMGGYAAGPGGLASWLLRRPLVIHEQNSVAGTTNRILYRLSNTILCAYPRAFGERQALHVGNPVRSELIAQSQSSEYRSRGAGDSLRLLVLGGSLGARPINELLPSTLALLQGRVRCEVVHQCGVAHVDTVNQDYARQQLDSVDVQPFIRDMAAAYAWADLVVCRAGALTLSELTIMGRPSLMIPLPHAIDNHQFYNAQWLAQNGGGLLLPQADLGAEQLAEHIESLANEPEALNRMSIAARAIGMPEASARVAELCQEVSLER